MYLVIFPEGTRYNPEYKEVITESQAFAAKEGTFLALGIRNIHIILIPVVYFKSYFKRDLFSLCHGF